MLETERLIIRFFNENDGDDLYEYLSLEEIYRFEPGNPVSREEAREMSSERAKGENFLAVVLKETGKLIGHISLFPSGSEQFATREIGYIFNPVYQNKGYCTEAVRAVIGYAFSELNSHRIVAFCSPENIPSWRVMEKCGMRQEAFYRKNAYFRKDPNGDPIWFDSCEYAILSDEFVSSLENNE
ncbi:MAG: GNAT family N-acetyltransferase [Dehalococcoidales bacterium]|nr:GNAT family N-acetyltransferase [Dehalococcoidales bacterium]